MSFVRKLLMAGVATGALVGLTTVGAQAGSITPGAGWQIDTASADNSPSTNSPLTFTISSSAYLSVTDSFDPGDIYTVSDSTSGTVLDTTSFTLLPTHWALGSNPTADSAWANSSYSHGQILLSAGSYSLNLEDVLDAGLPAGFFERLDLVSGVPVPEPVSLAVLGMGLAGLGFLRRRKT